MKNRPGHPSQHRRLEEEALRRLAAAFESGQWEVSRPRSRSAPDLLCTRGPLRYAIELKALSGRARRAALRALLADAVLQARAKAKELDAEPLAVIVGSAISDGITDELGAYIEAVGEGIAWGVLDERGRFDLHAPGLESIAPPPQQGLFRDEPAHEPIAHNPFSDLGQWMLKVLLAPDVPPDWLNAPRASVSGVSDLARVADVSAASASRLLSALEDGGYVDSKEGRLRLIRRNALFSAWLSASRRPLEERPARFLLPAADPLRRLREALAKRARRRRNKLEAHWDDRLQFHVGAPGQRACLALFSACKELGVGFVRGAPLHIYAENLSRESLKELQLQLVDHPAEADLFVRKPRFPESVFRACAVVDDAPVADIVQCWLDVMPHPARGNEQADEIARRLNWD